MTTTTREARTDPPLAPEIPATPPPDGTVEPTPPHSVTFADGRVAVLTENTAYDARMKRKALLKMGISPAVDQMDFTTGMAIMSIATLDGAPFKAPTTEMTLNAFLMDGLSEGDTYKLIRVYSGLIGEGDPDDATFRA